MGETINEGPEKLLSASEIKRGREVAGSTQKNGINCWFLFTATASSKPA